MNTKFSSVQPDLGEPETSGKTDYYLHIIPSLEKSSNKASFLLVPFTFIFLSILDIHMHQS